MKSIFSGVVMMRFVVFMFLQGAFCAEGPDPEPSDDTNAVGVQSVVLPPYSMADRSQYEPACQSAPPPSFPKEEGTPQAMEKEGFAPREDNPYVQVQFIGRDGTFYWALWNTFGLVYEGIAKIFPRNEQKQWQVLPMGYSADDRCAEFRLWFSDRGLSCTSISNKSQEVVPASNEIKRARLQVKVGLLEKTSAEEAGRVIVKYVTGARGTQEVEWKGSCFINRSSKNLVRVAGRSADCTDTSFFKHYVFVNASLECMLKGLTKKVS